MLNNNNSLLEKNIKNDIFEDMYFKNSISENFKQKCNEFLDQNFTIDSSQVENNFNLFLGKKHKYNSFYKESRSANVSKKSVNDSKQFNYKNDNSWKRKNSEDNNIKKSNYKI